MSLLSRTRSATACTSRQSCDILQVSGTDPGVVEFEARSLLLAADYLDDAGEALLADLRRNQGRALISSFGLVVDEGVRAEDAMEAYVESMRS